MAKTDKSNFQIWRDRIAHGAVAFFATVASAIPLLASPLGLLFLVSREYYQTKITMIGVYRDQGLDEKPSFTKIMGLINWGKDDLIDAYVGTISGLAVGVVIVWAMI
jgi:hypothetical protein